MARILIVGWFLLSLSVLAQAQIENILLNNSFEDESDLLNNGTLWERYVNASSKATFEFDEDPANVIDEARSIRIEIDQFSGTNWHIGLTQDRFSLAAGERYTLTFWAKAEKPRVISIELKRSPGEGPWEGITEKDFTIQQDWAEYVHNFICKKDYDRTAFFAFWMAQDDPTVWIDFVSLYKGDYANIQPSGYVSRAVEAADKLPVAWAQIKRGL